MNQLPDDFEVIEHGFVCNEHAPPRQGVQSWMKINFDCPCDKCDNKAAFFVMEAISVKPH